MNKKFTKLIAAIALLTFLIPFTGWGQTRTEVTDVMNQSWTGVTGTSYTEKTDLAGSASDAVYTVQCAGGNNSIQLRSNNNNSGIVSTTSGGTVTKVTVTWNSSTSNGRTLNVYGKSSAYSAASELYDNNAGTLIGTIVCGTSTELEIDDDYEYIGMRSASGAMYLDEIDVTWETGGGTSTPSITASNVDIDYNATAGSIAYTLNNATGNVTAAVTSGNWLTLGTVTATEVPFTCSANTETTARTAQVTLSFTGATDKVVTITQAGVPSYTVTYDCNGGTSGCPDNVTGITSGTQIQLADAPSKDDYIFNGWSDGTTTYGENEDYTVTGDVTFTAQWTPDPTATQYEWVETALADLGTSDIFVIVGDNGSTYAMTNDNGTSSAPAASAVTVENGKITSTVDDNLKWNIGGNATDGYTFYPNGSTTTWLYCTNTNNGVRVGTNASKTFVINSDYLYHSGTGRHVGIYNSQDWRCYSPQSGNVHGNISGQTFAFYKRQVATNDPYITAGNVDIEYDATGGSIAFTVNNEVTGGVISAAITDTWITLGTETTSPISFTCSANTEATARTATVTLTYTYNTTETVTKDVTIIQAAAPVIYTTIPAIFAAATGTETDVTITFNNWVVSAVKNSNAYLTDNNGNGLIIYASGHGFAVNDVLSGTASCKLLIYNGSAELKNLTSTTTGLTVTANGSVTEQNIAITDLTGLNTGALLHYDNLTYDGTNLVDGTNNTIRPYSTLYSGMSFTSGKTYNVTGIYLQYNTTKEILPRSAADIEEVTSTTPTITVAPATVDNVVAAGDDGTLALTYANLTITQANDFGIQFYDDNDQELNGSNEPDWIAVIVEDGTNSGEYQVSYIVGANNGVERTAYFKVFASDGTDFVYSNLVTITQEEYVAPVPSTTYTLVTSIVSGKRYIITNGTNKAMGAQNTNNRAAVDVTIDAGVATVSSDDVYEFVIIGPDVDSLYTIYDVSNEKYLNAAGTGSSNYLKLQDPITDRGLWTITFSNDAAVITAKTTATDRKNMRYNNGSTCFSCYGTGQQPIYLFAKDNETTSTITKNIDAYTDERDHYYLIASPFGQVTPTTGNNFLVNNYDLYAFNQAEDDEWRNYKAESFNLISGRGYLYANSADVELTFEGMPYVGNGQVMLAYTDGKEFAGWNLIGNPYNDNATVSDTLAYYTLNSDGSELAAVAAGSGNSVGAMEGIFVKVDKANQSVKFTKATAKGNTERNTNLVLNLNGNNGNVIDRTIVRFDEGQTLPKFMLNPQNTKLYIPQSGKDYAVVRSEGQGEMPVNFKAAKNGTYTLSVEAENLGMDYLHLIDNLTGANIDLLATPSYTFNAKTTDYASRFRLVFSMNGVIEENVNETFAYINGDEIVITNADAKTSLQVVDMMGRVLVSTKGTNSLSTAGLTQGVYVIRLFNGETVKTQKIVIQ